MSYDTLDEKNFGRFGKEMTRALPFNVPDGMPPSVMTRLNVNLFTGAATTYDINAAYEKEFMLPVSFEFCGVLYNQSKFLPFYNSPFYLKPEGFVPLARAKYLEAYVRQVDFFSKTVFKNSVSKTDSCVTKYLEANNRALDLYAKYEGKTPDYIARMIYDLSTDRHVMTIATKVSLGYFADAINYMEKKHIGIDGVYDRLAYKGEPFGVEVNALDIASLYERNKDASPFLISDDVARQFWYNLNTIKNPEQKKLVDLCSFKLKKLCEIE